MEILVVSSSICTLVLLMAAWTLWQLLRQVRQMFREIPPVGALIGAAGPQPGDRCPDQAFHTLIPGHDVVLTQGASAGRLVMFVASTCPISRKMIPIARMFCQREKLDLVFAGDDTPQMQQAFVSSQHIDPASFINDPDLGRILEVDKLPSAFLLDGQGHILARGLVNNREHLESLLNAQETGFRTTQDYLAARKAQPA
ncbi:thioredoxin domain-containing protein [Komagataeibacter diospyri]|uniref:Methylamine utilization protein MauD n=1 Tax=Komagataeibacter diospyri TaxID=1932662 RepID=A0A4P5NWP1_9PROT|nr:methylamine utilization protein MauD [Komagataeibacter diospyri]GCE82262.1 hypothetical protein MSKU9_0403 [Komagataeibacter diospyri]GCE89163.1 hypothetical protein MSKU15_0764 [Komagataeibacter diospyri]